MESAVVKNDMGDFGSLGIVLENQKVLSVRKDPYLYHSCNCELCVGMRMQKPLPYAEPRILSPELVE